MLDDYRWLELSPLHIDGRMKSYIAKQVISQPVINEESLKAWAEACFPNVNTDLVFAVNWLLSSTSTVVLTGVGMSTESNIPDFRSSSGWWKKIDPRTVATVEAFSDNYPLFQEFYTKRIEALQDIVPHEGHRVWASWEHRGLIDVIGTQKCRGRKQASS